MSARGRKHLRRSSSSSDEVYSSASSLLSSLSFYLLLYLYIYLLPLIYLYLYLYLLINLSPVLEEQNAVNDGQTPPPPPSVLFCCCPAWTINHHHRHHQRWSTGTGDAARGPTFINPKKQKNPNYKDSGRLVVDLCTITERPSFLDYIAGGVGGGFLVLRFILLFFMCCWF